MLIRAYENRDEEAVINLWTTVLFDAAPHNDPRLSLRRKLLVDRDLLLIAAIPENERRAQADGNDRAFFAFRLHQFISGAGVVYTTLDSYGTRPVELEGQQFLPADPSKRLYSTYFCRSCGQDYHPVRLRKEDGGLIIDDHGRRVG